MDFEFGTFFSLRFVSMLGGFPVTTARRDLELRMEERPSAMKGSCEYIE
jgi:hypothetical protein